MPYRFNPYLEGPNDNQPIWRYMDLARFLALLRTSTLHFARADQLEDKFEGSLTQQTTLYYLYRYEGSGGGIHVFGEPNLEGPCPPELREATENAPVLIKGGGPMPARKEVPTLVRAPENEAQWAKDRIRKDREEMFVNCWHASSHESAAMWKVYAQMGREVAVESDVALLKACFESVIDHEIFIGNVKYRDYATEAISGVEMTFSSLLNKRGSFAYEQEVRAIVSDRVHKDQVGLGIKVDLDTLIKRVVVPPQARDWFKELVRGIVDDYGLGHKPVETSSLDERPLW